MPATTPIARQWMILRILSARRNGATIRQLATELQVSVKTARRDLETLRQTGFPLEGRVEEFGARVGGSTPTGRTPV